MDHETQHRILDAAEQLFARRGYDGTSIREIVRLAGVNVAAVHYHFGSKEAVLRGVTDRVARPLSARRTELLQATAAAAAPRPPAVADVVDAFVRADVEVLLALQQRGTAVARFLGRTYGDQTPWIQQMAAEQFAPARAAHDLLAAALPRLDAPEVDWRVGQVVAAVVHVFATWPEEGMDPGEAEHLVARLVAFLAAGLAAPAPTPRPRAAVVPRHT